MAKRKEIILQEVFNTPKQWEDAMAKEKLYVVDVHQKWCGPCKAIVGMLRRMKNELGDDYLCFAVAEADSIPSLEAYRGKCEPIFLFFGCGQLVSYVRGCDAPLLQKTIEETLAHEHKVLNGEAERHVVKDLHESEKVEEEVGEEDEEGEEEGEIVAQKQITVALIKPDVVANGQVDEILEKINEAGIEVLVNDERSLTEEEAKSFYQNKADEEYFEDLISYVTSGPCQILVLTKSGSGEGIVDQWRDIIGPFDAAVAKEENPDSLRAIYGTDAKANALHGSSSQEEAARELGFFFPDFEPPTYRAASAVPSRRSRASARSRQSARRAKKLQRTLAIIRPDALKKHKDAIMEKIEEAGFKVSMTKEMQLSEEQAKAFYKEHEEQEYFQALVDQMTSGPVLALCLAHTDAVQKWRDMLGPKELAEAIEQQPDSLRAQFHVEEVPVNMLHGSDSVETATEELKGMFNIQQTLAVIKPDAMEQKDAIIEKLKEAGFMISCQKDMNLTREIAEGIYKSKEGAEFYDSLIDHMTSGSTLMMVLSAEDAVNKLRNITGPTDPDEAKESAPESLRALFAKSILENAIHSASSAESTQERIKIVFGDLEFDWDGKVQQQDESAAEEEAAPEAGEHGEEAEKPEEDKPEEGATEAPAADEDKPEDGATEAPAAEEAKPEGEPEKAEETTAAEGEESAPAEDAAPVEGEETVGTEGEETADAEEKPEGEAGSDNAASGGRESPDESDEKAKPATETDKNDGSSEVNSAPDPKESVSEDKPQENPPKDGENATPSAQAPQTESNNKNENSEVDGKDGHDNKPGGREDTSSRPTSAASNHSEKQNSRPGSAQNSPDAKPEGSTEPNETVAAENPSLDQGGKEKVPDNHSESQKSVS